MFQNILAMLFILKFDFLLFTNFSLHVRNTGKPVLSVMKANKSVHEALNVLCSFLRFTHSWLVIIKLSF